MAWWRSLAKLEAVSKWLDARAYLAVLIIVAMLSVLVGCGHTAEPTTPIAPVHATLYLHAPKYRPLLSAGGIVLLTSPQTANERLGYAGLVVVRALSGDEFYVFDLACPYERGAIQRLEVRDLEVRCPKCGSAYEVLHGSGVPISGPSRSPLRRYRAQYDAHSNHLAITN